LVESVSFEIVDLKIILLHNYLLYVLVMFVL